MARWELAHITHASTILPNRDGEQASPTTSSLSVSPLGALLIPLFFTFLTSITTGIIPKYTSKAQIESSKQQADQLNFQREEGVLSHALTSKDPKERAQMLQFLIASGLVRDDSKQLTQLAISEKVPQWPMQPVQSFNLSSPPPSFIPGSQPPLRP